MIRFPTEMTSANEIYNLFFIALQSLDGFQPWKNITESNSFEDGKVTLWFNCDIVVDTERYVVIFPSPCRYGYIQIYIFI